MDYGIPDLSLFSPTDAEARAALARHLTRAIEVWEPRLGLPEVTVERANARSDTLVARITGSPATAAATCRLSFELTLTSEPAVEHDG